MGRCTNNQITSQVNTNDVVYTGAYLPTLQIQSNSNLTNILQTLDTFLANFSGGSNYTIRGGTSTQTANGLTLVFNIPHGLGAIPDTYSVDPINTQTASNFSVSVNITNIIITYSVAPSQNTILSWVWQVIKL